MDGNSIDIISTLREEIKIKGVPIKETEMFRLLSDMNVSEQYVSDYSNSLHNLLKIKGAEEAEKKVLIIFRINPLVAVRIIESCSLVKDIDKLAYSIKPLFSVIRGDNLGFSETIVLNSNKVPYVIMLIEAVFQRSIGESRVWRPDIFLEYAQEEDSKLYKRGMKAKYLNAYNMRHILTHIPENRQIELINWFWKKHCYAASAFQKTDTFASGRVKVMINELVEGSMWHHLENVSEHRLSPRERERVEKERSEIVLFIENVFSEGRHMQFVKKVLGSDNFYDKLQTLMGNRYTESYAIKVEEQIKAEEQEKIEQGRLKEIEEIKHRKQKRQSLYEKLIHRVKLKYISGTATLEWHNLVDERNPQLNLWNYWQGSNFDVVKLMVLGSEWGSVNVENEEMKECKRKIQILMKNKKDNVTKYYSCKNKKTDYNLEYLLKKFFDRDLRKNHYQDLFFSNLCLGYRKSADIPPDDAEVISDITDFMPDELRIINPQIIFCLGEKVYQLFTDTLDAGGRDSFINESGSTPVTFRDIHIDDSGIRVYAMPDCEIAGISEMKSSGYFEIWNAVKDDMKQLGIVL